jgi:hypothetical protein
MQRIVTDNPPSSVASVSSAGNSTENIERFFKSPNYEPKLMPPPPPWVGKKGFRTPAKAARFLV